jgi:RecA/RadA recombinase
MTSRDVEIVITPTEAQYRELSQHLETLRKAGAQSNTAAILAAVRESAGRVRSKRHLREAA